MSTETDNDRATAVAIAQAQATAILTNAQVQAAATYDVALAQSQLIGIESSNQAITRLTIAGFEAAEIGSIAYSRSELIVAQASASVIESQQVSAHQATAIASEATIAASTTTEESRAQSATVLAESSSRVATETGVAQVQATTDAGLATIEAGSTLIGSEASVQETLGIAAARVQETQAVTLAESREITQSAAAENAASLYGATSASKATELVATIDATASNTVAIDEASGVVYGATRQLQIVEAEADSRARLDRSGADQDRNAALIVGGDQSVASGHAADDRYLGALDREDGEDARIARALSYAESKFNEVFPFIRREVGEALSATEPQTPGLSTAWPVPTSRGVFTPRLIQLQVNAEYARSDAAFAGQFREIQAQASGRGLSPNSPFLEARRAGLSCRLLREATRSAASLRVQASQTNSERTLESRKLRGQAILDRDQVALGAEGNSVDRAVGLLGDVAEMISGLA